nr:hypothetical protein [Faecalibaculum rodentium]
MANKFLGALGLDVLVNKIKDVITELSKKLSGEDVFSVITVDENGALVVNDANALYGRPIIKVIDVKNDNGTIIRSPGDYIVGFFAMHKEVSNSVAFWTTCGYGVLAAYDSMNFIGSSMIAVANWTSNDMSVQYNGINLQVKDATGKWIDFEFPTGTTVEEITADEVTNKFNS